MTKKILSFEEYAASKNFTSNDDIAEENEELCETCEKDPCICEKSLEDDEDEDEESKKSLEDDEDEDDEDEDDEDDEDEDEESDEELESSDKVEDVETVKSVAEMLETCYNNAVKEACDYDKDEYPDHTLESYLKENASLIATMSAKTLEQAYAELKDDALEKETYEACLNDMKDSYCKKIEELKETWSAM